MTTPCRPWWRNCALETDAEMAEIDRMEDTLAPIPANAGRIRELISCLELCHHKAERWVHNIVEAIGRGETDKGLGTRSPGQRHPAESTWQHACACLSAWSAGCPSTSHTLPVETVPASQLLAGLGKRSPLKEWQVQRVVEKIRSLIHWPQSSHDPTTQYVWMLFDGGGSEPAYRSQCPEHYREHQVFWLETVRTMIHDTVDGRASELSLGLAIDMLWPCHWRFAQNLQIVLEAIGGRLDATTPFAACGRNISLFPDRTWVQRVSRTLGVFMDGATSDQEVNQEMLTLLGAPTNLKQWLVASLDKTIRLQLNPPAELRALSALAGPAWIKQKTSSPRQPNRL